MKNIKVIDIKLLILIKVFLILFGVSRYSQYLKYTIPTTTNCNDIDLLNINANSIIKHTENLIDIGNSKFIYEESRSLAREYIRDHLLENGIPNDNIIWNRFEWLERKAEGRNITTTTWTGINIMVWINTTSSSNNKSNSKKIRVIGSHYDTVHWGENRTSGAHDNLSGTGLLMETIIHFYRYQRSIGDEDTPFLFVFFDQEEPGALGSKSFVDYYKIAKNRYKYAYFIDVDAIGYKNSHPIIETYPYEHQHQTIFTPRWLVDVMVQSAYSVSYDGIGVGSSRLATSLIFQAHRYHLISIPYLSDDGPFTWSGIDSLLLTDLDVFYGKNPDYHKITDQPTNLDLDLLKDTSNILLQFLISTSNDDSIRSIASGDPSIPPIRNPIKRLFTQILYSLLELIFSGHRQYLIIGPICLNYTDIVLLSTFILLLIYFTSFQHYRDLIKKCDTIEYYSQLNQKRKKTFKRVHINNNNNQNNYNNIENNNIQNNEEKLNINNNNAGNADNIDQDSTSEIDEIDNHRTTHYHYRKKYNPSNTINYNNNSNSSGNNGLKGYRILFIHLLVLGLVVLVDTIYCFEIIVLSFISLLTIHHDKYSFNLFTGFLSGAFCANFIYMDISQMKLLGRKGSFHQEFSLGVLLTIYIIHSLLIVIYGYQYGRKMEQWKRFERSLKDKEDLEK